MIYRTPRVFRRSANVEAGSGANPRLTLSAGPLTASREGNRCRVRGSALVFHRPSPARYIELPGIDHFFFAENSDRLVGEIQEFLTGVREQGEPDRVLATVLFADIVDLFFGGSAWWDSSCPAASLQAGIDAGGTRGDLQRRYGTSIGALDG